MFDLAPGGLFSFTAIGALEPTHTYTPSGLVSPGIHIPTGNGMRDYQIRASHKAFLGTPVRDRITGFYVGPERDGTNVHIDMGLGKTVIGLTAIADWFRFGICHKPVLVIAPIKVCETVWRQEALNWTHLKHLRFALVRGNEKQRAYTVERAFNRDSNTRYTDVLLINPELLKWFKTFIRDEWEKYVDAIVIDDVGFKDPKSQQFKMLTRYGSRTAQKDPLTGKALRDDKGHLVKVDPHRFKRAIKLTGTPNTSGLHRMWAPMYIMDHGARLHADFATYEGRFFHKTQEVADHVFKMEINKEEAEARPDWQAREGAPERIHELIADITIELNAADYGVLPQTIGDASLSEPPPSHLHRVELPDHLRAQYDALEKEAVLELEKDFLLAANGGAKSMMCWQMANGAIYGTDDFGRKEARHLHDLKLDKLVELIDAIGGNVIVPYYFQHDYARIVERLHKEGLGFASLKGRNTERVVDQWNAGNVPILLLHPQSAGHGLNLQFGGHSIIWFTLLWSLERYLQTNARLARSGQKGVVGIHHIVTSRTTDELMLLNLRQNGTDQEKFRAALREYQKLRGMGLYV